MPPLPALILFIFFLMIFLVFAAFVIQHFITYNYPGRALWPLTITFVLGAVVIVAFSVTMLFGNYFV